ncbi:ABC transporter [Chania multitudinisentens RB-25]|uniref:ABC transporter n=1 Tax=Chania multitudinisentens RB-25 TaxID=1441930 RepID=W0LHC2_9GAMM|nr:ABC transporter ATP-binding protein [Chania multitudinisentens]AHG21702.1 ABC transporter [Chania multitudinisentens RB-25]
MAETLLQVNGLSFAWPGQPRLFHQLDVQLRRGEVLAVLGPNGCGKSTLMQLLLGILPLQQGQMTQRCGMGFVPQYFTPPFAYKVIDIVLMGRARHIGLFRSPSANDHRLAKEALYALQMLEFAEWEFGRLSGGQRQLVLIARALSMACEVLILDEPTSALDLHHQDRVLTMIDQLAHERQMAVIFSTHQPNHAYAVADSALLLGAEGRHQLGSCHEILTAENLSPLFHLPIERISVPFAGNQRETLVPLYRSQREHNRG